MSRRTCTDKTKDFKHENDVTRRAPENSEIVNEIKDDLYNKRDTNHHMRFISERISKTMPSEVAEEAANKLRIYLITKGVNIRNADLAYHRLKSVIKTYSIVSPTQEAMDSLVVAMREKTLTDKNGDPKPMSNYTIYNYCYLLIYWARALGWKEEDIPKKPKLHLSRPPRMCITTDEVRRIIAVCKTRKERCIVALLAYTGMTPVELRHLWRTDVDLRAGSIQIMDHGQGIKREARKRKVFIHPVLKPFLRDFIEERDNYVLDAAAKTGAKTPYLFPGESEDGVLCPAGVYRIVADAGATAGIEKTVNSRALRHFYITNACAQGKSITKVQKMVGHRTLQSTVPYLDDIPDEELEAENNSIRY
jgi:integrase